MPRADFPRRWPDRRRAVAAWPCSAIIASSASPCPRFDLGQRGFEQQLAVGGALCRLVRAQELVDIGVQAGHCIGPPLLDLVERSGVLLERRFGLLGAILGLGEILDGIAGERDQRERHQADRVEHRGKGAGNCRAHRHASARAGRSSPAPLGCLAASSLGKARHRPIARWRHRSTEMIVARPLVSMP